MGIDLGTQGTITNPFGKPNSNYSLGYHTGIDIVKKGDTSVRALTPGKVVKSGYNKSYGNNVWIQDKNNKYVLYAHLKNPANVKKGDTVTPGALLGIQGSTGNSTGEHLHIEVRNELNNQKSAIDPKTYFATNGQNSLLGQTINNGGFGEKTQNIIANKDNTLYSKFYNWSKEGGLVSMLVRIILLVFAIFLLYAILTKGFL